MPIQLPTTIGQYISWHFILELTQDCITENSSVDHVCNVNNSLLTNLEQYKLQFAQ